MAQSRISCLLLNLWLAGRPILAHMPAISLATDDIPVIMASHVQEERQAWELMDPEDRPAALPQSFDSLRGVPAYKAFIKERFERCLDLYLCPRTRRRRPLVQDPASLVPKLPPPRDLRPFPHALMLRYLGHIGSVRPLPPPSTPLRPGVWCLCRL